MQDPLLERESLKEMANDEKLFNSQTAIAELKTRLEKLKLSLLYMGGTEEQKSKNLLPDESEQALFLAKLHAAHLLFAYREIRLGICSNKYYRDRELSHVMVATSNNGQMMKRMMEVSRQRFLRLLDCAEKGLLYKAKDQQYGIVS